jgi:hypothetical protein
MKPRIDIDEPMDSMSMTARDCPKRVCPYIESVEPRRVKLLKEKEEPKSAMSRTDKEAPRLARP